MRVLRRPLTIGETAMARSVFQGAIDYARVRVVRGSFFLLACRTRTRR